jgi:hypothetical protein
MAAADIAAHPARGEKKGRDMPHPLLTATIERGGSAEHGAHPQSGYSFIEIN